MNFANWPTCSSEMILDVNFSFSIASENFKIFAVPVTPNCPATSAELIKPSIETPSSLSPRSTTSRPNCFNSSPDKFVVFPTAINCLSKSLTVVKISFTMVPNNANPVTNPKVDINDFSVPLSPSNAEL